MLTRDCALAAILVVLWTPNLAAQDVSPPQNLQMAAALQRLERLEKQNQELQEEIRNLKRELAGIPAPAVTPGISAAPAPTGPSIEERLDVEEARTAELAQSKLDTSQ